MGLPGTAKEGYASKKKIITRLSLYVGATFKVVEAELTFKGTDVR